MSKQMSEECNPRTLYVGNLDPSVSEDLLCTLFFQIAPVQGCKIIREPGNDAYAFLEFANHQGAATALGAMNKRVFLKKEMKVNWATSPGNQPKQDTSNHYHIFVGDLSPEIETQTLREAFAPFGEISNCRIVRDPQTLKSKGYAFVSFVKKAEAENAIAAMNGQWLGSRSIRTNWSIRKPPPPRSDKPRHTKAPTYEEVYNQSSPTNCTVYCGGFFNNEISEELMHKTFSPFGTIQDIRVFKDKGYAFIRFSNKDSATRAIEAIHNSEINGQTVKCFWGKEDPSHMQPAMQANQYTYGYGQQQMGYWYPQQQSYQAAAIAQQQQYMHPGMQQPYAYNQYGYQQQQQQQGYMGRMGMQMANAWQGMPAQSQYPGPGQPMGAPTGGQDPATMQQQQGGGMMTYIMQ
ncbi:nucleolysin TIAR [Anabrus simplex]|uniref:nucleolysin TIAR n=1 Tax=Anabrus simplex TaxID=316456 RepID=UPI0034DD3D59